MKKMLLAAMAVVGSLFAFSQDSTVYKLEELVNGYYASGKFNGSVLVAQKGNILLYKGYGIQNAEQHVMNSGETVYQIASVTKPFTAAVILKLVELNKISLNDKLSTFYTGFDNNITIEHLLHHTSGITNITETDANIPGAKENELVEFLQKLPLDFPPGTRSHYSNSGYILLGHIIRKVSGINYYEAVTKYIFEPLDMKNSGFYFDHVNRKVKATGYDRIDANESKPSVILEPDAPFAAGAIYSTVSDLYRFHIGLQRYAIVSKNLMDKAYQPSSHNNYGYGWQIDSVYGQKMVSHSGSIYGFGSNFARIPADDICIVVLSNRFNSTSETMNITRRLLAVLYRQPYKVPAKIIPVALSEETLKSYEGVYEFKENNLVIDMMVENGKLVARPHKGPPSVMLPLGKNRFVADNDDELEIVFQFDELGKVKEFILTMRGRTGVIKKIK